MKKADSRQTQSERRPLLYFVACEPSGDQLGAKLITALASCATQKGQACPHLAGMGGPLMQACGLKSVLPFETFAIMGFFELFPRLPKLWSGLHFLTEDIVKRSPDILLTIDAPGLALRLAKRVRRRLGKKILIVHYVAPSVWAWKQGRARLMAGFYDHVLTLLPFEPYYFRRENLNATWVGHPSVETTEIAEAGHAFRKRHAITRDALLVAALPGSRRGEVCRLLPIFDAALEAFVKAQKAKKAGKEIVVAIAATNSVEDRIKERLSSWYQRPILVGPEEKAALFAASDLALAASGTVSVELGAANVPMVIAYRMNFLTVMLARRLLRIRWVSLINLLVGREVVPEYLQEQCTPVSLATALEHLADDPQARIEQQKGFRIALDCLGAGHETSPSFRAAHCLLNLLSAASPQI